MDNLAEEKLAENNAQEVETPAVEETPAEEETTPEAPAEVSEETPA